MSELTIKVEIELGPRAQKTVDEILDVLLTAIARREDDDDDED